MSYEYTRLFSDGIESDDPEVRKAAIADRERMFNEFRDAGVLDKDIEELDYWRYEKETLYFDRIGREFALTIEKRLPDVFKTLVSKDDTMYGRMDSITKIVITEFTGNFEELLTMLDKFENLKEVNVSKMLSINIIDIRKSHRDKCVVTVGKCSACKISDDFSIHEFSYPKIKIESSLVEEIGIFGNFVIKGGMEEWTEKLVSSGSTEFTPQIELECYRRFNSITIFNKIYGTKLRSLKGMNYELKVAPRIDGESLEGIVETTKFGYQILSKDTFYILFEVGVGEFSTGKLGVNFIAVDLDEDN